MLFDMWLISNSLSLGDRVGMSVGVETLAIPQWGEFIELVMALRKQQLKGLVARGSEGLSAGGRAYWENDRFQPR
jgi:hypothetical protein